MKAALDIHERLSFFNVRSREYLRVGYDRVVAARHVVEAAGALHGPALDVGTGKGLFAIELAKTGMEVVSVDINEEEQELAGLLAEEAGVRGRIRYICEDAARLSYPDGYYSCVGMMDVLHHLDKPEPVLGEMTRVLKDGGILVIADFNEQGFALVSRVHREGGGEHPRTTTTVALTQELLLRAGLLLVNRTAEYFHDILVLRKNRRGA